MPLILETAARRDAQGPIRVAECGADCRDEMVGIGGGADLSRWSLATDFIGRP
jgi:hypothetical protein